MDAEAIIRAHHREAQQYISVSFLILLPG